MFDRSEKLGKQDGVSRKWSEGLGRNRITQHILEAFSTGREFGMLGFWNMILVVVSVV